MKKLIIAGTLCTAFASSAALAQAHNFEGFGLQLSTGYQHNEIKGSNLTLDGQTNIPFLGQLGTQTESKGGMPLNLGISYTRAISNRFTLGALIEYNPLSMSTGGGYFTLDGVPQSAGVGKLSGKVENQVSISVVPGYAFTDTTMGYARVGWINASAKVTTADGSTGVSKSNNGILLGIGAKHLFTENLYGFAEATYAAYNGSNASLTIDGGNTIAVKLTPTSYSFLVGVGIRF